MFSMHQLDKAMCRTAKTAVKERDSMLKEVEKGMDQVKELYGKKVDRVEREKTEALLQCKDLEQELQTVQSRLDHAISESKEHEGAAQQARVAVVAEEDKRKHEVAQADARVSEVEKEMRLLLQAFEEERAASAAKAAQLADVLKAWR